MYAVLSLSIEPDVVHAYVALMQVLAHSNWNMIHISIICKTQEHQAGATWHEADRMSHSCLHLVDVCSCVMPRVMSCSSRSLKSRQSRCAFTRTCASITALFLILITGALLAIIFLVILKKSDHPNGNGEDVLMTAGSGNLS